MGTVSAALDLLLALLEQAGKISALIQTAQAAGQTDLPPDAWAGIIGADDSAEAALLAAIAEAKGGKTPAPPS